MPQSSASSGTKVSQWDLHRRTSRPRKKIRKHPGILKIFARVLGSMRTSSILLKIDIVPCSFAVLIIERYKMATEESG
jgi:hypothetical protein